MFYNLKSLKSCSLTSRLLTIPALKNLALFLLILGAVAGLDGCQTPPAGPAGPPYTVNMDSAAAHVIPIETARQWTARYRKINEAIRAKDTLFKDSLELPRAEAFNSDLIGLLLSQKDSTGSYAAGIRIYYSVDEKGVARFVLVPYDKNNNDIINHLTGAATGNSVPGVSSEKATAQTQTGTSGGQGGETGQQCPTLCSDGGGL